MIDLGYFQKQQLAQKIAVQIYKNLDGKVANDYDFANSKHPTEIAIFESAFNAIDMVVEEIEYDDESN